MVKLIKALEPDGVIEMNQNHKITGLFITFFKIGAFTFGGGYAMIPLIKRELTDQKKWISEEDIMDIIAIAESTPGPIAVNAATFVGTKVAGFRGALAATIGVVLPSYLIIVFVSAVLSLFEHSKILQYAFYGIRAGVIALVANAFLMMAKQCPKNRFSYFVAAFAFLMVMFTKINVAVVILACALLGIANLYWGFSKKKENSEPTTANKEDVK